MTGGSNDGGSNGRSDVGTDVGIDEGRDKGSDGEMIDPSGYHFRLLSQSDILRPHPDLYMEPQ